MASPIRQHAQALLGLRRTLREETAREAKRRRQRQQDARARSAARGPRWRGTAYQERAGQEGLIARLGLPLAPVRRAKASFWHELGPPPECRPGEFDKAKIFERRVMELLDRGGWPKVEYITLRKLAVKWGRRARGEDFRFVIAGTAAGRLPKELDQDVRAVRAAKEAEHG
jgi:hypothetical protein